MQGKFNSKFRFNISDIIEGEFQAARQPNKTKKDLPNQPATASEPSVEVSVQIPRDLNSFDVIPTESCMI